MKLNQIFQALIVLCFIAGAGCKKRSTTDKLSAAELVNAYEAVNAESESDVQLAITDAVARDYAVLFIHTDWSAMMAEPRKRFADFAATYLEANPRSVFFGYIDSTPVTTKGYRPFMSIDGWVELEAARSGQSLIQGWGEVVWLKGGRVFDVQPIRNFETTDELVSKTDSLFDFSP